MDETKDLMSWIPEEFRADCETYVRTMERLENLGIKTDKQAVICLAREIDFYRNKLRSLEGQTRARANAAMSVIPKEATEPHALILERIPQNMRDRISSIEHAADGSVTIYFDVEEKKENYFC